MSSILSLEEAVQDAKEFQNFPEILMTISLHPEWLVAIPEGRAWAILHHVVHSGDIGQLDQLLALQKSNTDFRLLAQTNRQETVVDVAKMRDNNIDMLKRIERLVKLDEMLNHAKECEWDACYAIVQENPSYGNEKPPYRRFYLIHHLACANDVKEFKRFQAMENFRFDVSLRADRQKVNVIARESGIEDFASYMEREYASYFDDDELDDQLYEPSEQAIQHTNKINNLMEQRNIFDESDLFRHPEKHKATRKAVDDEVKQKLLKQKPASTRNESTAQHSLEMIRGLLTCSLTKAIVTDPVVAADGFTYERTAIENWLKRNDCSPMTNEKLAHKNLSTNILVKQILTSIIRE